MNCFVAPPMGASLDAPDSPPHPSAIFQGGNNTGSISPPYSMKQIFKFLVNLHFIHNMLSLYFVWRLIVNKNNNNIYIYLWYIKHFNYHENFGMFFLTKTLYPPPSPNKSYLSPSRLSPLFFFPQALVLLLADSLDYH